MADKIPDFSKLWAINGQRYQFTDDQYLAGWDCIGSIPPARQQFDALQYLTDVKLRWLYEKCEYELTAIISPAEPTTQRAGGVWIELQSEGSGGSQGGGGDTPAAASLIITSDPPVNKAAVWGDLQNDGKGITAVDGGDLKKDIEVSATPPLDKSKIWGLLYPDKKE